MSITLHSMLARHSRIRGAFTTFAGIGVNPNFANLSVSAPEQVPMPTTASSWSTVGMAMTHSRVRLRARNE